MKLARFALAAAVVGVAVTQASAQLPQTRITALFPIGAKAGDATEVTIANGADLDDVSEMLFNHPGIQAKKKDGATNVFVVTVGADVPTGVYEARVRGLFGASNPRSFVVGTLPETREVEPNNTKETATAVTIGSVVNGQSNGGPDVDFYKLAGKAGQRVLIECEALNADSRFQGTLRLSGTTGKQLASAAAASGKDPLLDVTLPADGEYLIRVADAVYGTSTEYPYRLKIHSGPHIDFVSPPAGVPGTTGTFTIYGRNLPGSQPSNMTIGTQKLEQLQVQIAVPNTPDKVDASTSNSPREAHGDAFAYSFKGPNGASNTVPIAFAPKPLTAEVEPNNDKAAAQKIAVPAELGGSFQSKGDVDIYEFEAKAQQVLWIEAFAQRIGSPADPFMTVDKVNKNEKGEETLQRLTAQDDSTVNAVDAKIFDTNHDDVSYRFVAPADGTYRVTLRDRYFEARGAANLQYQLAIRDESPDFRLVIAMPFPQAAAQRQQQGYTTGELVLRRGENMDVLIAGLRRHGFAGVIEVTAENLPAGVTCIPAVIGAGLNSCSLVFAVAEDAKPIAQPIRIVGKARLETAATVVAHDAAVAALKKAEADKKTTPEDLAKLQAAVAQTKQARDAAAKDVAHEARPSTIVWSGNQQTPSQSRLAQTLTLSVVDEIAPLQVVADPVREVANHNRQILVPVKLAKRNGFDNNVVLTAQAVPQNLQVQPLTIEKGKAEGVLRIFVPNNVKEDTYTLYLEGAAQVPYLKNVGRLNRAKAEAEAAVAAIAAATEAQKKAVADVDAAGKAMTAAAEAQKKAQTELDAAKKKVADATKTADEQKTDEAKAALKTATDAAAAAEAALTAATAEVAKTTEAKKASDAAKTAADAALKAANDRKTATDNEVKAADTYTKSLNNGAPQVFPPSSPIVITVKKAPFTLATAPANGGNVKKGEKVEVKVTVTRINGYTGPVKLTLPAIPNLKGITADPVEVPADKNEGTLVVTASADAPDGAIANLVVRAEAQFEGPAASDQPVTINVQK